VLQSDSVILCVSENALKSEWIRRDVLLSLTKKIPIITIVPDNVTDEEFTLLQRLVGEDADLRTLNDIYWLPANPSYEQMLQDLQTAFSLNAPQVARKQGIFISYRRADSIEVCGRIYDRLAARFGSKDVFRDVINIPAGTNFATFIDRELAQCAVTLVIIGKQWASITNEDGKRRLEDPEDLVRIEVETALKSDKMLVIPLLIGGAKMPKSSDLPESLQGLTMLNAMEIRHDPDFHKDLNRLIEAIETSQKA
jgi:hypothetical protein